MNINLKKNSFSLSKALNFTIKNEDKEIQKRNIRLYSISFWLFVLFIVTLIPFFIYSFIVFNNNALDYYFDNYYIIKDFYNGPDKNSIIVNLSMAFALLPLFALLFIFYKPFMTAKGIDKNYKVIYIASIIIAGTAVLFFAALSQYFYSNYQEFYIYESVTGSKNKFDDVSNTNENISTGMAAISEWYSEEAKWHPTSGEFIPNFTWQSTTTVWWTMFIQVMILAASAVSLQNRAFAKAPVEGIEKYVKFISKDKQITGSKFKNFVNRIFRIDDKTLSVWTIVIAAIIMAPQFIFIIIASSSKSSMGALINWNYKVVELIRDYEWSKDISAINPTSMGLIMINSLPLISLGITLSTTFFFLSVSVRGQNVSNRVFIAQYVILFVELIVLVTLTTISKLTIEAIGSAWKQDGSGANLIKQIKNAAGDDWIKISELYALNNIDAVDVKFEWFDKISIISETIMTLSIVISGFGILSNAIWKSSIFKRYLRDQIILKRQTAKVKQNVKNSESAQGGQEHA